VAVLALLCSAALVGAGESRTSAGGLDGVWVEREAAVMGTRLRVALEAPRREAGFSAIEAAVAGVRAVDDLLSTWRGDTELAAVNGAPLETDVALSARLTGILGEVWRWQLETNGAFDPAIGALVDAWDLRGRGRRPSPVELGRALEAVGLGRFHFDEVAGTVTRTDGRSWIDAGAFGKGAALREAWLRLEELGVQDALLDFGGQVLAQGSPEGGGDWIVAVAHPARRSEPAVELRLSDRAAATTGQAERFIEADGRRFGHVLDPRSGEPVPAWGSVTVVASDPLVADVLSTALFVMGPEAGMEWVRDRDEVAALFLVDLGERLEARWNRAMNDHLVKGD
jgi:thiamine biosynthesis lipoprotein